MEIRFLGSGAAQPTPERLASATLVGDGKVRLLVDCGEGTARELMRLGLLGRVEHVLVTHAHVDHIGGLHGLVRALELIGRRELHIHAPQDAHEAIRGLCRLAGSGESFVQMHVVTPEEAVTVGGLTVEPFATEHEIESVGYRITEQRRSPTLDIEKCQRHGLEGGPVLGLLKREGQVTNSRGEIVRLEDVSNPAPEPSIVVLTGDTRPCEATVRMARGADVLVHDATYLADEEELARGHYHSTATDAARCAIESGVGMLVLTHFSARYEDSSILVDEARGVIGQRSITVAASDTTPLLSVERRVRGSGLDVRRM